MNPELQAVSADIGPGFAEPAHGAQQTFRAVLEAMSRPGRVLTLPAQALHGLPHATLSPAMTAVLLSLLDAEVNLWFDPAMATAATLAHLRFHTGVRPADRIEQAAFVATAAAHATPDLWARVHHGNDGRPQDGATLLIDVPALQPDNAAVGPQLRLSGPGIEHEHRLHVGGIDAAFWAARAALGGAFPRGVELILCCGMAIAALPRTTRVTLGA